MQHLILDRKHFTPARLPCSITCFSSIIAKKKGRRRYYYVVTSKRVHGKPRIVDQTYLGTAEAVRQLVRNQSALVPLEASSRDLGLPGVLWQAALSSGAFEALLSVWPAARKGPSIPHFLLLAASHRICCPGPKTRVADWYSGTVLPRLWGFPASSFSSQSFWNRFDQIAAPAGMPAEPMAGRPAASTQSASAGATASMAARSFRRTRGGRPERNSANANSFAPSRSTSAMPHVPGDSTV